MNEEKKISEKSFLEFQRELAKLDIKDFIGLATVLSAPVFDEENNPREAMDIISDMCVRFAGLRRERRREIIKLLKDVNKSHKKKRK